MNLFWIWAEILVYCYSAAMLTALSFCGRGPGGGWLRTLAGANLGALPALAALVAWALHIAGSDPGAPTAWALVASSFVLGVAGANLCVGLLLAARVSVSYLLFAGSFAFYIFLIFVYVVAIPDMQARANARRLYALLITGVTVLKLLRAWHRQRLAYLGFTALSLLTGVVVIASGTIARSPSP